MTFSIDLHSLSVVVTEEADLLVLDSMVRPDTKLTIGSMACAMAAVLCPNLGITAPPKEGWMFAFTSKELMDSFSLRLSRPVEFEEITTGGTPQGVIEGANTVIGIQHQ